MTLALLGIFSRDVPQVSISSLSHSYILSCYSRLSTLILLQRVSGSWAVPVVSMVRTNNITLEGGAMIRIPSPVQTGQGKGGLPRAVGRKEEVKIG
jgi:hypothetical protein